MWENASILLWPSRVCGQRGVKGTAPCCAAGRPGAAFGFPCLHWFSTFRRWRLVRKRPPSRLDGPSHFTSPYTTSECSAVGGSLPGIGASRGPTLFRFSRTLSISLHAHRWADPLTKRVEKLLSESIHEGEVSPVREDYAILRLSREPEGGIPEADLARLLLGEGAHSRPLHERACLGASFATPSLTAPSLPMTLPWWWNPIPPTMTSRS